MTRYRLPAGPDRVGVKPAAARQVVEELDDLAEA